MNILLSLVVLLAATFLTIFQQPQASFPAIFIIFKLNVLIPFQLYPSLPLNCNFFRRASTINSWLLGLFVAKQLWFLRYGPRILNQRFTIFDLVYIYILYGFCDSEKYCGLRRDHTVGTQIETLLNRGSNSESRTEYISELVLTRRF